jgi:hypothetical protein
MGDMFELRRLLAEDLTPAFLGRFWQRETRLI